MSFSMECPYFCCDPIALTSSRESKEEEVSVFPDSKFTPIFDQNQVIPNKVQDHDCWIGLTQVL